MSISIHKMRSPFIGLITAFFLLFTVFPFFINAEEPNPDKTENQIQPPDIEFFLQNGIFKWTNNNPYMKEFSKTRFWEDLELSGQFISILTMGTQLERQSGLHLDKNYINELLDAPMEISLWNAFEKDTDMIYVIVMDIKPQFQYLVKLAEVYSQTMKKSTPIEKNQFKILQTKWLENTLYHLMVKNQLVVSNNIDYLLHILSQPPKDGIIQPFRNSDFYKKYNQSEQGSLKCRIDMAARLKKLKGLFNKDTIQLAVNMDLDEKVNFYSLYLTASPGFFSAESIKMEECTDYIPREPILAVSGIYDSKYYINMIKDSPYFNGLNEKLKLDMEKDIIPSFKERFFLYIDELENKENPKIINGVVGLSLDKLKPAQKQKLLSFVRVVMTNESDSMTEEKDKNKPEISFYHFNNDPNSPAFCILDKWILFGTGPEVLKKSLSVYTKRTPSLSDGKGYRSLEKPLSKKGFMNFLFEPARFLESLLQHLYFLQDYDFGIPDIELKMKPVADIFSKIQPFSITWELQKDSLKGTVQFAENK